MPKMATGSRRTTAKKPSVRDTTTKRQTVRRRPLSGEMGGTETETVTVTDSPQRTQAKTKQRPLREYGPTQQGERVSSSVGLLEAEFLGSLFLLILLLFTNTDKTYGDKIMSLMKRGTLLSILFFILALISGTGPNATKVAKAIGGLVFMATLLTTPGSNVIIALDKLFKANWAGTTEHGTDIGQSNTGTSTSLGNAPGAVNRLVQIYKDLWHFTWGWIP